MGVGHFGLVGFCFVWCLLLPASIQWYSSSPSGCLQVGRLLSIIEERRCWATIKWMNVHQSDQQASVQPVDDTTNHAMCTMTRPTILFCFCVLFLEGSIFFKKNHSPNDRPSVNRFSSCSSNDHPSILKSLIQWSFILPSILLANTKGGVKKELNLHAYLKFCSNLWVHPKRATPLFFLTFWMWGRPHPA
jgi:hypothetical protein